MCKHWTVRKLIWQAPTKSLSLAASELLKASKPASCCVNEFCTPPWDGFFELPLFYDLKSQSEFRIPKSLTCGVFPRPGNPDRQSPTSSAHVQTSLLKTSLRTRTTLRTSLTPIFPVGIQPSHQQAECAQNA